MLKKYQELNYSLTMKNQELLEQAAALKQEINKLNRRLLTERQLVIMLRNRYCRFLGDISKCCDSAIRDVSQPLDMLRDIINNTEQDVSPSKSISRRSMRLVQLTIRQIETAENEKENRDPTVEPYREDKMSYVQDRRRRRNKSMPEKPETLMSLEEVAVDTHITYEESVASKAPEILCTSESLEQPEELVTPESIQDLEPDNLFTICEENTMDLSKSCARAGLSATKSIFIEDSSIESLTIRPASQKQQTNSLSSTLFPPPAGISRASRGEKTHMNSNFVTVEDTLCANFHSAQVTSSTPYKTSVGQQFRECYVKLKKIGTSNLPIINSADDYTEDVITGSRNGINVLPRKQRKFTLINFSGPKLLTTTEDTLSDSFRTVHVVSSTPFKPPAKVTRKCFVKLKKLNPSDVRKLRRVRNHDDDSFSSSNMHTGNSTGSRPKRRAAPKNLQEPKLGFKLRREN